MEAEEVIERLGLEPHPEGGHFKETWRAPTVAGDRPTGSAIYFLLRAGERSHWHRIDADELWHFHAGGPLRLSRAPDRDVQPQHTLVGPELALGQRPQSHVPAGWWQSAETTGAWTLVSCTVSPAFHFEGFELAPPGFRPGTGT